MKFICDYCKKEYDNLEDATICEESCLEKTQDEYEKLEEITSTLQDAYDEIQNAKSAIEAWENELSEKRKIIQKLVSETYNTQKNNSIRIIDGSLEVSFRDNNFSVPFEKPNDLTKVLHSIFGV